MFSTAVLDAVRAHAGPWTWPELEELPEGFRYEIDDGELVMAPAPGFWHDRAARLLANLLEAACPPAYRAGAPAAVTIGDSYREPDAIVALPVPRGSYGPLDPATVLLVAEVVSPTSGARDRQTKLADYAAAGIAHYWIVAIDPEPVLVAYALRGGVYVEVTTVVGDETYEATDPFPVSVTPGALLR